MIPGVSALSQLTPKLEFYVLSKITIMLKLKAMCKIQNAPSLSGLVQDNANWYCTFPMRAYCANLFFTFLGGMFCIGQMFRVGTSQVSPFLVSTVYGFSRTSLSFTVDRHHRDAFCVLPCSEHQLGTLCEEYRRVSASHSDAN